MNTFIVYTPTPRWVLSGRNPSPVRNYLVLGHGHLPPCLCYSGRRQEICMKATQTKCRTNVKRYCQKQCDLQQRIDRR